MPLEDSEEEDYSDRTISEDESVCFPQLRLTSFQIKLGLQRFPVKVL